MRGKGNVKGKRKGNANANWKEKGGVIVIDGVKNLRLQLEDLGNQLIHRSHRPYNE